jgi:hypothetical protein
MARSRGGATLGGEGGQLPPEIFKIFILALFNFNFIILKI